MSHCNNQKLIIWLYYIATLACFGLSQIVSPKWLCCIGTFLKGYVGLQWSWIVISRCDIFKNNRVILKLQYWDLVDIIVISHFNDKIGRLINGYVPLQCWRIMFHFNYRVCWLQLSPMDMPHYDINLGWLI